MKGEHLITHGKSNTRLYGIYRGMWRRCYNKNHEHYNQYGGRGITICDEWLHDFMNFYKWAINNGYDDNLTIDRIDNNKGYSPNNCRWVNQKIQVRNRKNTVKINYNGVTKPLSCWAEDLNVPLSRLQNRYYRKWNVHDILFGRDN